MLARWPPSGVAAFSYGSAALAFVLLFLLLLQKSTSRRHGAALGCACLLTAAWAAGAALSAGRPAAPALQWLELLRTGAWLLFLQRLLYQERRMPAGLLAGAVVLAVAVAVGMGAQFWPTAPEEGGGRGAMLAIIHVSLAVLGMLLVEHLYRNTPPAGRWGIKFACLAIGALFAFDFYLYSDALLFRHINTEIWAARGLVTALCAPLIGIAAARNRAWAPQLMLSRQILFRS
ncbi:MAG TPA: PEP-CTERM system histidine kinase PrsK, partial [Burkholderiaceae bacterium]|nr:PEP-CTERM system histidine kinase PrsK [Burkholderiaceae bacterium]